MAFPIPPLVQNSCNLPPINTGRNGIAYELSRLIKVDDDFADDVFLGRFAFGNQER